MQKVGARRTVSPNESADSADVGLPMSKLILDIRNLYNNYNKFSFKDVVQVMHSAAENTIQEVRQDSRHIKSALAPSGS